MENYECNCPNCKSENVQKLSVAYADGMVNTKSNSTILGTTFGGNAVTGVSFSNSVSQSELSKLVAPPEKQSVFKCSAGGLGATKNALTIDAILAAVVACAAPSVLGVYIGSVISIVCMIYLAVKVIPKHFAYQKELDRKYEEDKAAWDRSYICLRCGTIYDPKKK